jgi:CheY-like chemotaxis protein
MARILLAEDNEMKNVPAIALTAHALVTNRERALKAGFDDYDSNQGELPRLLIKIDAFLKERMPA